MKHWQTLAQLITRAALGLGFLLPVLDRFGTFGINGTPGVTWGDWPHFVDYTHSLMPYVNSNIARFAAVVATAAECVLAAGLIVGYKLKWMALGAALLTFIFGVCMIISLGISAPFNYPVFVFTGAALLLMVQKDFRWSIDSLLSRKNT